MKAVRFIPSFIIILISLIFCVSSFKLGLGRFHDPGPGLIPFLVGILLILFSVGVVVETYSSLEKEERPKLFEGKRWRMVLLILLSLFIYVPLLDILGFPLATFLLLLFLFKISEEQTWKVAFFASLLTTGATYLLFDYTLNVTLPTGIFGF
jgi:putative tricarboxylic transport membrane protein